MRQDIRFMLTINTGSSSVRLALFEQRQVGSKLLSETREDISAGQEEGLLREFMGAAITDVDLVVHRVVYGGNRFGDACPIDDGVEREIEQLKPVAPLHNPLALLWIHASRQAFGENTPMVAVFDTAFFSGLPEVASTYALPRELCREHGLRRHGFHGIAHRVMLGKWQVSRPDLPEGGRVITVQLGSGCSITAIGNGDALDTSMGFSPLEGLVMATRPGDLDPGLIIYLQQHTGMTPGEIDRLLNDESGLRGISGLSGDMRDLLASADPDARLAVEIYCYRVRKYIGAYVAVLGGVDGIVFGGGVGENSPVVRQGIIKGMGWLGASLDTSRNERALGADAVISAGGSLVEVRVAHVDESTEMARIATELISSSDNEGQ